MRKAVGRVAAFLQANPVRVRSAVVAVLTLVGVAVPSLAGLESNDLAVGAALASVSLVLGRGAAKRVVLPGEDAPAEPVDAGYEGKHR